jgi:hypothetical protein
MTSEYANSVNSKLQSVRLEQSSHSDEIGREEIYTSLRIHTSERVSYDKHKMA